MTNILFLFPLLASLTNLFGIPIIFDEFLKNNSYSISACPISITWYPALYKSLATIEAVGANASKNNLLFSIFNAALSILLYKLKEFSNGDNILLIDFTLSNKVLLTPSIDFWPSIITISFLFHIFFNFPHI